MNNSFCFIYRLSYPEEALCYFKKAWNINNNYLPAYLNIQATNSLLVERWHFRMLNDSTRNKSYNDAIIKKVQGGCKSVLDIGSGTGILRLVYYFASVNQNEVLLLNPHCWIFVLCLEDVNLLIGIKCL